MSILDPDTPMTIYQQKTNFSILREKSGLSLQDVADKTGRSLRTIYRWEKGETPSDKLVTDMLVKASQLATEQNATKKSSFTFIDLFAGIGGMRMGFEAAGGECVFTSEWNKFSRQTYLANFPSENHDVVGDITQIDEKDIPKHDVLVGGFPCQPFSIAGVSKKNSLGQPHGFECSTQGTLFFDIERIIAHHRPAAFLLENVKNLRSHDKGNTFKVITQTLKEKLGYNVTWRVINAKSYVPQNRQRIFIVGFRDDVGFDINNLSIPNPEHGPLLGSILHPENGAEIEEPPYTVGDQALVAEKYTLTPKLWEYLQNYAKKHKEKGNGFGFGLVGPENTSRTLSARYYKDGSEILIKQVGKRPRRLTPRECARLMGFDRANANAFQIPVSDTQAYKQFGNAVAVPVVTDIANFMVPYLLGDQEVIATHQSQLPLFSSIHA